MTDDTGDKHRDACRKLAAMGGSQPDIQAVPRRRSPFGEAKCFNPETGDYDLDPPNDRGSPDK